MDEYPQQRAQAARWIYDRRGRVDWWRWQVLTEQNKNDTECLKLAPKTAFLIFSDLVQAGLFVPVIANDGVEGFTINPGKETEWTQVMHPRWHSVRRGGLKFAEMLVSGVVGAVLGVIATLLAQNLLHIG